MAEYERSSVLVAEESKNMPEEERVEIWMKNPDHYKLMTLDDNLRKLVAEYPEHGRAVFDVLRTSADPGQRLTAQSLIILLLVQDVAAEEPHPEETLAAWQAMLRDEDNTVSCEAYEVIFELLHGEAPYVAGEELTEPFTTIVYARRETSLTEALERQRRPPGGGRRWRYPRGLARGGP
ncbi:MAG: hypothetical protein ACRDYX_04160 [Egibacteraceae bacterium]